MTHDKQRSTAASFCARMPSSGSQWYTPEVTAVYNNLLAMCTRESASGGYWLKFDNKPANCSDELFELVKDRLSCEGFRVAFTDLANIIYSIDWVQPCAFQCDALEVQMLNPVMLRDNIEKTAYHLCVDVIAVCNHSAMKGKSVYNCHLSYAKYSGLGLQMHVALVDPVIERLIMLLKDQGFTVSKLQRCGSNYIEIKWA